MLGAKHPFHGSEFFLRRSSLQNLANEGWRRVKSGDLEKLFLEKRKVKTNKWGKVIVKPGTGKCSDQVLSLGDLRWPYTCNAFTDWCSEERGGGRQKSAESQHLPLFSSASFSTLHK